MSHSSKCAVCARLLKELDSPYCVYHTLAYERIISTYQEWVKSYGALSWERYLETILALVETGDWAKQVAEHQLSLPTSKSAKT